MGQATCWVVTEGQLRWLWCWQKSTAAILRHPYFRQHSLACDATGREGVAWVCGVRQLRLVSVGNPVVAGKASHVGAA
jgi:hypothetical protein